MTVVWRSVTTERFTACRVSRQIVSPLSGDRRVLAISEADRNGETWVCAECRSARACASLLTVLERCGVLSAARKGKASLWLERAEQ